MFNHRHVENVEEAHVDLGYFGIQRNQACRRDGIEKRLLPACGADPYAAVWVHHPHAMRKGVAVVSKPFRVFGQPRQDSQEAGLRTETHLSRVSECFASFDERSQGSLVLRICVRVPQEHLQPPVEIGFKQAPCGDDAANAGYDPWVRNVKVGEHA